VKYTTVKSRGTQKEGQKKKTGGRLFSKLEKNKGGLQNIKNWNAHNKEAKENRKKGERRPVDH